MKFSIITICYNAAAVIERTLQSISVHDSRSRIYNVIFALDRKEYSHESQRLKEQRKEICRKYDLYYDRNERDHQEADKRR